MHVFSHEASTAVDAVKSKYVFDNEEEDTFTLAIMARELSETPHCTGTF